MYSRDDNLGIVKSVEKLTDWARSPRAKIFKILHSVDMMVFKNTKWPTCVYMNKHITQTVVIMIFLIKIRWTKTEELIWYCVYMLFSPRVRDTCTKIRELSGYITPRTHYIHFLDESLLYMPWSLVWKVKGRVRVYSHDVKLQG